MTAYGYIITMLKQQIDKTLQGAPEIIVTELKQEQWQWLQKCYLKSEPALPQTLSPLFHLV